MRGVGEDQRGGYTSTVKTCCIELYYEYIEEPLFLKQPVTLVRVPSTCIAGCQEDEQPSWPHFATLQTTVYKHAPHEVYLQRLTPSPSHFFFLALQKSQLFRMVMTFSFFAAPPAVPFFLLEPPAPPVPPAPDMLAGLTELPSAIALIEGSIIPSPVTPPKGD